MLRRSKFKNENVPLLKMERQKPLHFFLGAPPMALPIPFVSMANSISSSSSNPPNTAGDCTYTHLVG